MKIDEVRKRAFAMPLTSPAFPPGPYRFVDREFLIITYRTDPAALEAVVPEPLTFDAPIVKYEFIRMPFLKVGWVVTLVLLFPSQVGAKELAAVPPASHPSSFMSS